MPTRLDYLVISSIPFALQADQRRTLMFDLPPDLLIGPSPLRPLLVYKARALAAGGCAANAELVITLNKYEVVQVQIEGVSLCGLWEAFPGHLLKAGITNTVQFRLMDGSVQVAGVVLWFRRRGRESG